MHILKELKQNMKSSDLISFCCWTSFLIRNQSVSLNLKFHYCALSGISVGCADNYLHNIDCQWIDITDLPTGSYTFRVRLSTSVAMLVKVTSKFNIGQKGSETHSYYLTTHFRSPCKRHGIKIIS